MKALPIRNIEKFEKNDWKTPCPPNCELFWCGSYTYHYLRKTDLQEGIKIIWDGNPFDLDIYSNYVLEK